MVSPDSERANIFVDGSKITSWTRLKVEKRLNEVDTFKFEAFQDSDDPVVEESSEILVFDEGDFVFKGYVTNPERDNSATIEIEGEGASNLLLNRKTKRNEFKDERASFIVKQLLPTDVVQEGTIEQSPFTSLNFDHDNIVRAIAGAANAVGYDWVLRQEPGDDYQQDFLDFKDRIGSSSVVETFTIGENAQLVETEEDDDFVSNDITLLGYGDGNNQIEARVWAAAADFTQLDGELAETATGTFTVNDTSVLGSTGDTVKVKVGVEIIRADIQDGTTLNIQDRAVGDFDKAETKQITHRDDISVWLYENETQGRGPFTPETRDSAEAGSSIAENGVKQNRETDRTILELPTLEQVADRELRDRYRDAKSIKVKPSKAEIGDAVQLGDEVKVVDNEFTGIDDSFKVIGKDFGRRGGLQGTTLVLRNRSRRLVERLSEVERDRDTLNAHMQGATNIDSQNFSDNADSDNPLNAKLRVPDDAVAVNKTEVTFTRQSFRGYVQNQPHTHEVNPVVDEDTGERALQHSHNVEVNPVVDEGTGERALQHSHDLDLSEGGIDNTFTGEYTNIGDFIIPPGNQVISGSNGATAAVDIPPSPTGDTDEVVVTAQVVNFGSWNTNLDFEVENVDTGDIVLDENSIFVNNNGGGATKNATGFGADTGDTLKLEVTGTDAFNNFGTESGSLGNSLIRLVVSRISTHDHGLDATLESELGETKTQTSNSSLGSAKSSEAGGKPTYGIFEPSNEPLIDVELIVDGTTVKTFNDVGVGDEIDPQRIEQELSQPIAGNYHDITLKPVATDGGNNGRCKLDATVYNKVFIESKI